MMKQCLKKNGIISGQIGQISSTLQNDESLRIQREFAQHLYNVFFALLSSGSLLTTSQTGDNNNGYLKPTLLTTPSA